MTLSRLIKKLRKEHRLTQTELAKRLNVAPTTVSAWEQGYNKPLMDKLVTMSKMFDVPIQDFFKEEKKEENGVNHSIQGGSYVAEPSMKYPVQTRELPLYGDIAAGALAIVEGIAAERLEYIDVSTQLLGKHSNADDLFVMKVNGESMNKVIPDDSYVICKPMNLENIQGNDILIFSHDNAYSMKRYYEQDDVVIFSPESTTNKYEEIEIPKDTSNTLRVYAKVIGYSVILD
ncbi:helix-turn-helix domain-containing protein [Salicibibacter cibarius]|uniref:Helix-turn-helix domain-containing protein n=1 Tax=Salicibibacter cibarius TaxID=2743000 RepID=A0A7T6Z7K7_9BACI|nr:XRE family transcriptional regulator [Salicibibacter cibarius]QQK77846.1 helix-turn-helix domain-containing protein [Salicibibacter cibarius]